MSDRKEILAIAREAEKQGWVVTLTGSGHYKFLPPNGMGMVICSSSPSDHFTLRLLKRDLRVRGFIEITKSKRRKR